MSVPTVSVLWVPRVSDAKNVRYADAVPAFSVRVLMVWLALNVTGVIPTDVRAPNDSVLKVFVPVMVMPFALKFVKATLLKVKPVVAIPGATFEKFICEVPALKVKFVVFALNALGVDCAQVIVEPLRLTVLTPVPVMEKNVVVSA